MNAKVLSLVLITIVSLNASVAGADVYQLVLQKQEEKKKTRWSLQDWLETRDRMMLMDMWLAHHAPSPYEFFFTGDYQIIQKDEAVSQKENSWSLGLSGYATIVGISFLYENRFKRWTAGLHLRIFGFQQQGTNITLHGGIMSERDDFRYRNPYWGVSLTLYLLKYAGIEGMYRHYFNSSPVQNNFRQSGNRYEGTAFIDFSFIRLYGTFYLEKFNASGASLARNGISVGTRLFF